MNRIVLKGSIPSPANPPAGCKFHTRCEKCMEECKYCQPKWKEIEPGHFCACHLFNDAEEKEMAVEEARKAKLAGEVED